MGRYSLFLTILILVLDSCGSAGDDTVSRVSDGESISFAVETDAKTRGSVIGGLAFPLTESFRVFSWKTVNGETSVMMRQEATDRESNVVSFYQNKWQTQKSYYWPTDESATVSFYAVFPADYTVTKSGSDEMIDIIIPADVSRQADIMTAKTEGVSLATSQNGAAQLGFRHITSQVSFRARLAAHFAGWRVDVRGIRLCNVNSRGTYSYGSSTVTPASPAVRQHYDFVMAANSVTVDSPAESDIKALTSPTDVAMLMPQTLTAWDRETETGSSGAPSTTGSYLAIDCTITDSDGHQAFSGITYVPFDGIWQAARHYGYLLEFGSGYQGDGEVTVKNIGISCTITDWLPGNNDHVDISQD